MSLDVECKIPGAQVFVDKDGVEYSSTLAFCQVSASGQGSNKYYIIQVLYVPGTSQSYGLYTRYGRIGEKGVSNFKPMEMDKAIREFKKTFASKTGNVWGEEFRDIYGKYIRMQIEKPVIVSSLPVTAQGNDGSDSSSYDELVPLPVQVDKFLRLITDRSIINSTVKQFNVDPEKLPLGKISDSQLKQAHDVLKKLKTTSDPHERQVLSSKFWTLVPYAHGRQSPPIITDVTSYIDLLDILKHLQVTGQVLQHGCEIGSVYSQLGVMLYPLDNTDRMWDIIHRYINESHAASHSYKLAIQDILVVDSIDPSGQNRTIVRQKDETVKLLFHGSRTPNFVGILKEGLRIPHHSQVVNGAALGYGIYFADSVSKSFNYCSVSGGELGVVVLCEVNLGSNPQILTHAPFDVSPSPQYTSRYAKGKSASLDKDAIVVNDVVVPLGKHVETGLKSSFLYNEYAVFDKSHYKFKYIVTLRRS